MRPLQAWWPTIRQQVLSARPVILCCDFDGTLVPIAEHPAKARLSRRTAHLLRTLARQPVVFVAVISGRALRDLKRMVGVRGLYYVGNHGLELEGPKLRYVNPVAQANQLLLKQVAGELKAALRAIPGAWVEWKALTFSVHWRRVPLSAQRTFHRLIAEHTAPYLLRGTIRVTSGKRVVEVRPPVRWNKGDVVLWLVRRLAPRRPQMVVYLGDDQTDEDAFRVVNRLRGYSVVVGRPPHPTAAAYQLAGPREVYRWLGMAARTLRSSEVNPRR